MERSSMVTQLVAALAMHSFLSQCWAVFLYSLINTQVYTLRCVQAGDQEHTALIFMDQLTGFRTWAYGDRSGSRKSPTHLMPSKAARLADKTFKGIFEHKVSITSRSFDH
ncbi:hypothetical protein GCK32_009199 [Trichostrongylus colubriformis]|uniref:Uncharacterized protein n=1 Tax=Trichostrongylus colubriformis TaxID=6319 RepID=A0AAN8G3K1_TRICO